MASIFKPTYTKIDPKTGKRIKRKARKWYVQYRDSDGDRSTPCQASQTKKPRDSLPRSWKSTRLARKWGWSINLTSIASGRWRTTLRITAAI